MKIRFVEFKEDIDELIKFLTTDTWEYHGTPNPNPARIRDSFKNQYYSSDDAKTFWVIKDQDSKVGMVRVYDLQDGTPLLDIRVLKEYKGKGVGTITLKWLIDYVFHNYIDKDRIEGDTRQDNYGMRCVFHKCGFAKEAHYRKAWPDNKGKLHDSIGYGITREDWEAGKTTQVNWNDFKC